jgi:hypothetical protein
MKAGVGMAKMTFKEVDALKPTENIYKRSVDRGCRSGSLPTAPKPGSFNITLTASSR